MTTRRNFLTALPATGAAFAIAGASLLEGGAARAQTPAGPAPLAGHFHPKGKAPSTHTVAVLKAAREGLPFADTRDFDEQKRGLIAQMKEMVIRSDAGHPAWDMERFRFLDQQDEFDSIHLSLHRISKLNNNYGLYEVIPGIYQVRGFDLSDITFMQRKRRLAEQALWPMGDIGADVSGLTEAVAAPTRGQHPLAESMAEQFRRDGLPPRPPQRPGRLGTYLKTSTREG